ncbi:MAG: leucine-rich repeat domain-containing protein, partial [Parachlamydiaceae bacterium]|nr:leucine-rich repeat domain-containing protein [Parachlamydiaceae bacterium]
MNKINNMNLSPVAYPSFNLSSGFEPLTVSERTYPLNKGLSEWTREKPTDPLAFAEIKDIITECCNFPEMKKLQAVSNAWSAAANEKTQWQSIGNLLELPTDKCDQENIKNLMMQTQKQANDCFPSFDSFWDFLSTRCWLGMELSFSHKIEDINTLRKATQAISILTVWAELENQANIAVKSAPKLDQTESIDELLIQEKAFQEWFKNNLVNLLPLDTLYLSYGKLTYLPPEIGQLTQLTQLNLANNNLTFLPSEIGKLAQLSSLYLDNNQLAILPSEIGKLIQLRELSLSHNQLAIVPSEIGQLAQLRILNLSHNQLASVPSEIGQLAQLEELNLNNNQLASVPSEIGQLQLGILN